LVQAIDGLEADVLTIENSRSGNEMINALAKFGYSRDIGPGVYDVHSPVVPRLVKSFGRPADDTPKGLCGAGAGRLKSSEVKNVTVLTGNL